jgi:hypothetical protein
VEPTAITAEPQRNAEIRRVEIRALSIFALRRTNYFPLAYIKVSLEKNTVSKNLDRAIDF